MSLPFTFSIEKTGSAPALIALLAFGIFCFMMLCSCIYREEDRDERVSWAAMIILFAFVAAPCYYWRRYRLLRAQRRQAEAKADADFQEFRPTGVH